MAGVLSVERLRASVNRVTGGAAFRHVARVEPLRDCEDKRGGA